MTKFFTFLAVPLIFLVGCETTQTSSKSVAIAKPNLSISQEDQWHLMVGKWYGNQPSKEGGAKQWIVERYPNGNYRIDFRTIKNDGNIESSSEVGQWGVSGPVYFSSFRGWLEGDNVKPSDPSDPYNYDAYQIIKLNNEIFEYEHFLTGNRFTLKRVSSDFKFD
ncbi:hypothetical protein [Methylophaga muralis]|uniref:Lipoprotein n=1 Tax=Methylophaga muralis TaxID=291169 RepID=A0A1E3GPH6_9GAMM|nr:hypothetical protein [Methylophaga muralis]ODN65962.1 hypothetical protein A9E74_02289 [Methylophaga muralis]